MDAMRRSWADQNEAWRRMEEMLCVTRALSQLLSGVGRLAYLRCGPGGQRLTGHLPSWVYYITIPCP